MRVLFYIFLGIVGGSLSLVILAPSLFDIKNYKSKIEDLVLDKTGSKLVINGKISLSFFPRPQLLVREIYFYKDKEEKLFESNELILSPDIFSFLKGDFAINSIKIDKPFIYIKEYEDGTYNWTSVFNHNTNEKNDSINKKEENINKKKQFDKNVNPLNVKLLSVRDANIFYNNEKEKHNFEKINLSLNYKKKNNYFLQGNLEYKGSIYKISYNFFSKDNLLNLKGQLNNSNIIISNDGKVDLNDLSGKTQFSVDINSLNKLTKSTQIKDIPISINGNVNFSKKQMNFYNLVFVINDNTISGTAKYKLQKKNKYLNLNFQSDNINLDNFLVANYNNGQIRNKKLKENNKVSNDNNKRDLVDELFIIPDQYILDFRLLSKELIYKKHRVNELDLKFKKNKKLKINLEFKNIFNGNLLASIVIKKNKNSLIDMQLNNLDIEEVNKFKGYDYLLGFLDLKLRASSNIEDKNLFIKNLSGSGELHSKKTIIKNINIKNVKSKVLSVENIKDLSRLSKEMLSGNTKVNDQKISFNIDKGNIKLPKTVIQVNSDDLIAKGFFNLDKKELSLNLNYDNNKNELLSLLTLSFTGNINNISTKLNYNKQNAEGVINNMLKKKLKKKVKEKLDKKFNNIIDNLLN